MGVSGVTSPTKITNDYVAAEVKNKSQQLGKDEFLKLLLAQMKYQDPLDPMDNKESIAQMAQFSSLEKMENLNTTLASFGTYQKSLNSLNGAQFIGKDIEFSELQTVKSKDDKGNVVEKEEMVTVKGKVNSVSYEDGEPRFEVVDEEGEKHTTKFDNIKSVKDSAVENYSKNTKLNSVIAGASMVGRTVEGTFTEKNEDNYGNVVDTDVKVKGTVKSVSFTGDSPTLKIAGEDGKEYTIKMENVLSVV